MEILCDIDSKNIQRNHTHDDAAQCMQENHFKILNKFKLY